MEDEYVEWRDEQRRRAWTVVAIVVAALALIGGIGWALNARAEEREEQRVRAHNENISQELYRNIDCQLHGGPDC